MKGTEHELSDKSCQFELAQHVQQFNMTFSFYIHEIHQVQKQNSTLPIFFKAILFFFPFTIMTAIGAAYSKSFKFEDDQQQCKSLKCITCIIIFIYNHKL